MRYTMVDSKQDKNEKLLSTERKYSLNDITDRKTYAKISGMLNYNVPFYPPTMSPADTMNGELESLEWALNYYAKLGHKSICIQKKHMGSRCVVILRQRLEDCFAVSKNGWIIDHIDIKSELERLHILWKYGWAQDDTHLEIILDCELMPWSAMGQGLIDNNFKHYSKLSENEIKVSQESGYEQAISKLSVQNHIPLDKQSEYIKAFNESLSNYDSVYDIKILPFQVLRMSSSQNNYRSTYNFTALSMTAVDSKISGICCDIDDLKGAQEFVKSLDIEKTEGVVVKPILALRDQAPYLKVRNKEYLRLVYGPDYTDPIKLDKLIKRKNIRPKLNRSILEWNTSYDALRVPLDELESIFCKLFSTPEHETDPRL